MSMKKRKKGFPKLKKGQKIGIGVGVALLAAFFVFGRNRKFNPELLTTSWLNDPGMNGRGFRNNNPGNIIYNASNDWKGKIPYAQNTDTGRRFEQFETYALGVRAMIVLISNYLKNMNTIEQIVYRYNPGNPNYVKFVSAQMGISANAPLTANKATIKGLVQAMANFENGVQASEYPAVSDDMFEAAWSIV
jgi:hypothetical protein